MADTSGRPLLLSCANPKAHTPKGLPLSFFYLANGVSLLLRSVRPHQRGILLAHLTNLGNRHRLDIRLPGVIAGIVLMVVLRGKKVTQRFEGRQDRPAKMARFVQSADLVFGNPLLFVGGVENG